ncbi:MAG TPA: thiamine pyrophosphate-dependent enzyme [Thermoanaerobaculaceae bacterium]|nr:thiamine pyrophosphate-dependent enzyme [Thermoanaerobaculaceae bacterium]
MPTPIVEKDRCKGCELCINACPENVLVLSEELNAKGYFFPMAAHPESCTGCRYCVLVCPDVAIQIENKGKVSTPPESLTGKPFSYCPGCTHGVIHRLVAETIDSLGIKDRTVGIAPVGCSVLAYEFFGCDMQEASHGRAMAVATGIKRGRPDLVVFTYQGDGDLASIGMAETVHAANRGEKITVIFVNNAIYGMTGGQMAPTTLPGQVASTCPTGRDPDLAGYPIRVVELLRELKTPAYLARVAVHDPKNILNAKKAIRRAFKYQLDRTCFSLIEVVSTCPTGWGYQPHEACEWLDENMLPYYPLGEYKSPEGVAAQAEA